MGCVKLLILLFLCRLAYAGRSGGKGKTTQFAKSILETTLLIGQKKNNSNGANIAFSSHWYQPYRLGYKILLVCEAIGKPIPTIRWFKDNSEMGTHRNRLVTSRTIDKLTAYSKVEIDLAMVGDQGVFTCLAQNENGADLTSFKTEYI